MYNEKFNTYTGIEGEMTYSPLERPETVIVTRHAGTIEWLAQRGITGTVIAHATSEEVAGKEVIGALPWHLAALARSVTVIDLPGLSQELRGKDLTPQQMDEAGALLTTYVVSKT